MKNKIDNILLGLLWLVASMLATCFWFNTQYGFDLFSKSHWHHLAYMQASQKPVQISFYISIILALFIIMFVLYLLLRPNLKHTTQMALSHVPSDPQPRHIQSVSHPNTQGNTPVPRAQMTPQPRTVMSVSQPVSAPQLNIPRPVSPIQHQPAMARPAAFVPNIQMELNEIFTSAGYKVTKNPEIKNTNIVLTAIGSGETLWIGGANIPVTQMRHVIDVIKQVFIDTLDETMINMTGFIVNPVTFEKYNDILTFKDTDELRRYMMSHTNPDTNFNDEAFIAYETYINTVMDYIGKL